MLDKSTYIKFSPVLHKYQNMDQEFKLILNAIEEYYNTYREETTVSIPELKNFFYQINPSLPDADLYDNLFNQIDTSIINNKDLLIDNLNKITDSYYANQMVTELIRIMEGRNGSFDTVEGINKERREIIGSTGEEEEYVHTPLSELLAEDEEGDLKWRLPFLNDKIGSPPPGTLGHIFAYSETGKSSFALDTAASFAFCLKGTDQTILYLNNEERIDRIKLRSFSAFLNASKQRIVKEKETAIRKWGENGGEHLKLVGDCNHISVVEQNILKYKPLVTFIDQGPKVGFPGNEKEVRKLQLLYNWYREKSKELNTCIITLGQADASCEKKKWLKLSDMDSSKVGIPGELDFAIGIGKDSSNEGLSNLRYISVCKNKVRGLHSHGSAYFDSLKCRYKERGGNN